MENSNVLQTSGQTRGVTHQQGAWQQSAKWNISKVDVRSAERDSWLEQWLSENKAQKSQLWIYKRRQKKEHLFNSELLRPETRRAERFQAGFGQLDGDVRLDQFKGSKPNWSQPVTS